MALELGQRGRFECRTLGIMGGLGFTMSILIAGLAFSDPALELAAKCAILAGSVTSTVVGLAFVRIADAVAPGMRRHRQKQAGSPLAKTHQR